MGWLDGLLVIACAIWQYLGEHTEAFGGITACGLRGLEEETLVLIVGERNSSVRAVKWAAINVHGTLKVRRLLILFGRHLEGFLIVRRLMNTINDQRQRRVFSWPCGLYMYTCPSLI
jgi:hypothetical protein